MSTTDVCEIDDVLSIVVVGICSNVVTIKIFPVKYCIHNNFEDCIVYLCQMFLCQSTFYFPSLLLLFLFVDGLSFSFFLGASLRNDGAQFPDTKSSSSCCISLILPVMFL